MPFLVALALSAGTFMGYVLGDTKALQKLDPMPSMEQMTQEAHEYLEEK